MKPVEFILDRWRYDSWWAAYAEANERAAKLVALGATVLVSSESDEWGHWNCRAEWR